MDFTEHIMISAVVIFTVLVGMIAYLVTRVVRLQRDKDETINNLVNMYSDIRAKIDMINNRVVSVYNDIGNVLLPSAYSLDKHLMEIRETVEEAEDDTKLIRTIINAHSSKLLKNEIAMKHVLEFVRIMSAYRLRDELQRLENESKQEPPEDLNADENEKNVHDSIDF